MVYVTGNTLLLYNRVRNQTQNDAGSESTGGRGAAYSGGTGITPKTGGSGNPKYIWNRIGTVKHIMTDVFKTCKSQFKTL